MSDGQWGGGPPQGPGSGQPQSPQGWGQNTQTPQGGAQQQSPQGWGQQQQPQQGMGQPPAQPDAQAQWQQQQAQQPGQAQWGQPQQPGAQPGQAAWSPQGAPQPGQQGWNQNPQQPGQFGGFPSAPQGASAGGGAGKALGIAGAVLLSIIGFGVRTAMRGSWRGGAQTAQDNTIDNITGAFRNGMARPDLASQACGYRVSGLTNVILSNVQLGGVTFGTATANVVGTPLPGGVPIQAPSCSAGCRFHYQLSTTRGGRYTRGMTNTNVTDMHFFRQLALGEMVTGTLADGDSLLEDQSRVYVDYGIQLNGGQPVTIVVRGGHSALNAGQNLDVLTGFFNSLDQRLADDDDSAGNLNSRIVFTPPSTGLYYIRVTTASGDNFGAFQVQTFPGANPNAT